MGALLLAAIGVYGTLALGLVQRTRELAIRRALGATGAALIRAIGLDAARVAVLGTLLGVGGGLALNRLLAATLYEVRAVEPRVCVAGSAVLLTSLIPAAALPLRRSLRIGTPAGGMTAGPTRILPSRLS